MNKLMKKKKKGFTLIELIAVIAILAILAVVAVPRVIKYVDKSKRVAIQTEASTIYNAAEAAYNDGKLTDGELTASTTADKYIKNSEGFDKLSVANAVKSLKSQDLLSGDENLDKFGTLNLNLSQLKKIMSAKTDEIDVDSQGVLQKMPGTTATTATGKTQLEKEKTKQ